MSPRVEVGSIVRVTAPGSRSSDGEERVIPALVIGVWPDGSLQLYCLHFEGNPILANAVPLNTVEVVFSRAELGAILEGFSQRITQLENQLAGVNQAPLQAQHNMKYAIDDAH